METEVKTWWKFIEDNYPNYDSSNEIAYADDLQKIVSGEINGAAEIAFKDEFDNNLKLAINAYYKHHFEIMATAIESFQNKNK